MLNSDYFRFTQRVYVTASGSTSIPAAGKNTVFLLTAALPLAIDQVLVVVPGHFCELYDDSKSGYLNCYSMTMYLTRADDGAELMAWPSYAASYTVLANGCVASVPNGDFLVHGYDVAGSGSLAPGGIKLSALADVSNTDGAAAHDASLYIAGFYEIYQLKPGAGLRA